MGRREAEKARIKRQKAYQKKVKLKKHLQSAIALRDVEIGKYEAQYGTLIKGKKLNVRHDDTAKSLKTALNLIKSQTGKALESELFLPMESTVAKNNEYVSVGKYVRGLSITEIPKGSSPEGALLAHIKKGFDYVSSGGKFSRAAASEIQTQLSSIRDIIPGSVEVEDVKNITSSKIDITRIEQAIPSLIPAQRQQLYSSIQKIANIPHLSEEQYNAYIYNMKQLACAVNNGVGTDVLPEGVGAVDAVESLITFEDISPVITEIWKRVPDEYSSNEAGNKVDELESTINKNVDSWDLEFVDDLKKALSQGDVDKVLDMLADKGYII